MERIIRTYPQAQKLPAGDVLEAELKAEGATLQSVASRYGVSRQAVHRSLMRWRARSLPNGRVIDAQFTGGMTYDDIADEYNSSASVVRWFHTEWRNRDKDRARRQAKTPEPAV